jgi:hypothetical protein
MEKHRLEQKVKEKKRRQREQNVEKEKHQQGIMSNRKKTTRDKMPKRKNCLLQIMLNGKKIDRNIS